MTIEEARAARAAVVRQKVCRWKLVALAVYVAVIATLAVLVGAAGIDWRYVAAGGLAGPLGVLWRRAVHPPQEVTG